ncbi:MAG: FtsW/RodA/SpoVE family cell cycle protein [Filifactoraceae bacterium]
MEREKKDENALRETLRLRAGNSRKGMDLTIFILVVILVIIGIISIYSASYVQASLKFKDSEHFLMKSIIFACIGMVAMMFMAVFDYRLLKTKPVLWGFIAITIVLYMLTYTRLGVSANGSLRWVNIYFFQIQPSEVAKLTSIIFVAYMSSIPSNKITGFSKNTLINICKAISIPLVFMILTAIQPSMTTVVIMGIICACILFVGGINMKYVVSGIGVGLMAIIGLLVVQPYRLKRLEGTFNPFLDPQGTTFQTLQSVFAISSGGLFGLGIGASRQKYFYLPEAQNDFIFAIIAEESGFIGACVLIGIFIMLIFRCLKVANNAQDKFGSLLVAGVTSHITIQFLLNLMVATSIFPNTGVGLPFVSYGGSSLIILLVEVGIVLNVSKHERRV